MKIKVLRDNKTAKKAKYKTLFGIKLKNNILNVKFAVFHCSKNSFSNIYNDDIYKGDVCELFLYTGINQHYYEFEIAPNKTLFFADITNDGKSFTGKRLNNNDCFKARHIKLGRFLLNSLTIDLSKLKVTNYREIKYNAFRIETDGDTPEKYLFALNPTKCSTFHKFDFFINI